MLVQTFKAARRVSAPIVAITTADQWAAVQLIIRDLQNVPLLTWDLARGLTALNTLGRTAFSELGVDPVMTMNPGEALGLALRFPPETVLFCYNFHRVIGNEVVSQAVWNTREKFKTDGRTLVLLGPDMPFPAELKDDVLVIDDVLPTEGQLRDIIDEQLQAASLEEKRINVQRAVDAVAGLAAFPAEQAVAMSFTKNGIDIPSLWERKRQAIEQTPGLSVYRGNESFDDIGGLENAKQFGRAILAGQAAPRAVVFIDEIEKAMAGSAGDTSGVSQDMLGVMLSWMQDKQVPGMLLVGPPGAAKSAYAKAFGNTAGVPTIAFDLGAMKGSLVGESGRNLRGALKVVDAVAQGRAIVLATCNSLSTLPPELRRRFTFGTFFFDLPTALEREMIWKIYIKKYTLEKAQQRAPVKDDGWTGAEIRQCCDLAWRLNQPLSEAAMFIVPVAKAAAETITQLREQASGRFISASYPGTYQKDDRSFTATDATVRRRIREA